MQFVSNMTECFFCSFFFNIIKSSSRDQKTNLRYCIRHDYRKVQGASW